MENIIETQKSKSYINDLLSFLNNTLYSNFNGIIVENTFAKEDSQSDKGSESFSPITWLTSETDCLKTVKAEYINNKFQAFDVIVSINFDKLRIKIDELNKTIAEFFIRSVISGEYINGDYEENLRMVVKISENYYEDFIYCENDLVFTNTLFNDVSLILQKSFVNVIKEITDDVLAFITDVNNIEASSTFDIIHIHKSDNLEFNKTYILNLKIVIAVYYLEHTIEEDNKYISRILSLQNTLNQVSKNPSFICTQILNIKVNFLKQKWYLRKHKTLFKGYDDDSLHPVLIIDNVVISIHENFDFISGNDKLINWIKEIEEHYNINKLVSPYNFRKDSLSIKGAELKTRTNKELRSLIKYYQEDKKNSKKILEIIEELSERAKVDKKLSLNILYAYNCLLSLYLKKRESKTKIYELYDIINDKQKEFGIINFFAKLKILKYEVDDCLQLIENYTNGKNKDIEVISKISINELENKLKLLWAVFYNSCKYNRFLYYLPYQESSIKSDSDEVDNVYYPSSIFLPIAYSDNDVKIKEVENKINKIRAYLTSLDLVKDDINEIKIVKDELKDSNKRIIEIVSMFTAIISFILGSVGAFSFISSFAHAMLFVVLYGTCISFFVVLFYFMNRGFKFNFKHLLILVPYLIIFYVLYIYLLPNYQNDINNKLDIKEEKLINRKLDSLQNYNKKTFNPIQSK